MILSSIPKNITVLVLIFSLIGCSTPFLNTKKPEPNSTNSSTLSKKNAKKPSSWQQAYGIEQEEEENTLPPVSKPFQKPNLPSSDTSDVWQRIRDGFSVSSDTLHPDTEKHLEWFVQHPEYINRMVERARPYLYHIVAELDKRNMPLEVALLPVVESGFKPFAYSSGKASGIWQFIPGTGKVYGLEQNWWYDGRRDIIDSSRAAMDYLEKLHNDFGDWQLALAAYNCGEGTVGRAIKKNSEAGKPTDFWSLDLPKETSAYVPKLMAVSELVKNPEKYDITLSPIDNTPYLTTVDVGSQIDIAIASDLADMTTDEMYMLNPAFNQWATPPQGPHRLVLPIEKAQQFKTALKKIPVKERVKWKQHKVQSGETLSLIAKKYNTTVNAIKVSNNLQNTNLRVGKFIQIPVTPSDSTIYELTAKQRARQQNASAKAQKRIHIVKQGDTWWDLANAYGVDVHKLTSWNGKSPRDTLHIGQKLTIWKKPADSQQAKATDYTIKQGDSLWKIARAFDVSIEELRQWNNLSPRTLIKPGQKLTLYVNNS